MNVLLFAARRLQHIQEWFIVGLRIQLFVGISCFCGFKSCPAPTKIPAREGPYVRVLSYMSLQFVFGATFFIAHRANIKTWQIVDYAFLPYQCIF